MDIAVIVLLLGMGRKVPAQTHHFQTQKLKNYSSMTGLCQVCNHPPKEQCWIHIVETILSKELIELCYV